MTGREFYRRVRTAGKRKGVSVKLVRERGKGSHSMLYFGGKRATLKDLKAELGKGLLHAMLEQLGLSKEDL